MIATIAIPISTSLNAFSSFPWLTTTYLLGSTIAQAISGHLVDIFGRRKGLLVCYGLFALGTLLCGLAHTLSTFLAGRVLQGIGGGAVCSIIAVVETDLIPMEKRPLLEGLGNVCYGVVLALGGVYGAGFQKSIGWRWAFLVQVPVMVVDGAVVFAVVKVSDEKRDKSLHPRIDLVGMITLLAAVILFEFGLNTGSTSLLWSSAPVIAPLVVAAGSFAAFVFWETRVAHSPVVPIKAVIERSVGLIQLSAFLTTGAFVSVMFYISIYLETLGLSSIQTGLRLIPLAVVFGISSIVAGYIVEKTCRYYHLNIFLQVLSSIFYGLLCMLDRGSPSWETFVFLGFLGVGIGGSYVTNLMGILTSIPTKHTATVQAASWAIRSVGVAVGLTISSAIFQSVSRREVRKTVSSGDDVSQFSTTFAIDTPQFAALNPSVKQSIFDAYIKAVNAVFYLLLAQSLASTLLSLFIKDNKITADHTDHATSTDETTEK